MATFSQALVVFLALLCVSSAYDISASRRSRKTVTASGVRSAMLEPELASVSQLRPAPVDAPQGTLLVLHGASAGQDATAGNTSVTLSSYSAATGKLTQIAVYPGYYAGSFSGLDVSGKRAFIDVSYYIGNGTYAFDILTIDIVKGSVKHKAPFPAWVVYESDWDDKSGVLVGMYEQIDPIEHTANLSVATVSVTTGNVESYLHTFPNSSSYTFASFDHREHVMFSNPSTGGNGLPPLATIDYSTGETVHMVNTTRFVIRPTYDAASGLLIDSSFYFANDAFGLVSIDPTTGNFTNLNITIVEGVNTIEIGPCAVDSGSQTYFGLFRPGGAPNPEYFYQIDLSKGVITRKFEATLAFFDLAWLPASITA